MKIILLVLLWFSMSLSTLYAQGEPPNPPSSGEVWEFKNYCVGEKIGNEARPGTVLMPNVLQLDGGGYRMYYNKSEYGKDQIKYAESTDGLNWTVKGVIMQGSSNPQDRTFILGGPSVVKVDGGYRMYYRCAPAHDRGVPPKYHIRSAFSTDGINFKEEEGIRIEIKYVDPSSPFELAGHGAFYRVKDGTFAAIFSANADARQPSDLYVTTSKDGIVWGNFKKLYTGFHDPTVVIKDGKYYLYAMYLHFYHARAISEDGVNWPAQMEKILMTDSTGVDLTTARAGVGDFGAGLSPSGEIRLYTNYGNPSSDIVVFELKNSSSDLPPTVRVTSPAGGESFEPGDKLTVNWTSQDDHSVASHALELTVDSDVVTLATGLTGSASSFDAVLPANITAERARVRVTATDNAGKTGSGVSGEFRIARREPADTTPPQARLLSPNGGEKVRVGSTLTLQWQATDDRAVISQDLFLSTDGGASFPIKIATGLPGSENAFVFTMPETVSRSKRARVRVVVRDAAGNSAQDDSDGDFRIRK